uniref:Rieske domain-containing protein n=1 Tax=viral metagenome TaxID=1070528 RepID=A0A6C0DCS8_9ZZZZ
MIKIFFLFLSVVQSLDFFNHWHCIGIKNKIDLSKPYKVNIGELPLVLWNDKKNNKLITTINICKHMGSRLDNGVITESGCLKCQYHGLEMSNLDNFGETIEYQGKIFWSYKPKNKKPGSIPFYNNKEYETSFLEIDMDCSLTDSAFNTMDIRHPEYVHNKIVGFGNNIYPTNIKYYNWTDQIGLSFDYSSNRIMRQINDNTRKTSNFHMYQYPSFTWSRVSFNEKHLIIGVNFLPLGKKKTRWYVTLCHNYYKSEIGKKIMKLLALTILSQDFIQMYNQYEDNELKKLILFNHKFVDEEPILELNRLFKNYEYPDVNLCAELYKKHISENQDSNH